MSDQLSVQAGWAVWSKHPGTRDDYAVLYSSSGPLSTAEFSSVLTHFAPGNPPANPSTPSSLPWVTLNRVGVAQETYLGVSTQVPTEHVDATGRPVSRTSYLCVPYADLARVPVSYADLSAALSAAQLPYEDGAPLPLELPRLDPSVLARSVLEFGPEVVATTAALLLAGPVTITAGGADLPDVTTRVRFLDAVAAMLPYGYRASFTAATWSDNGAGPRFRIVFAQRARDESSRLTWGVPARVPAEGAAGRYFEFLRRITAQPATDVAELTRLIGYLAGETAPGKYEQPQPALASLGEFFRAVLVEEALDAGDVQTTEIRRLFANGQDQQLTPARRRELFGRLIAAGDTQDWPLVSERFSSIANNEPRYLLPSLTQACRRPLRSGEGTSLAAKYLRLARMHGLADDLLAGVVGKPGTTAESERGLEAAGSLLAAFVIEDLTGPETCLRTRQGLARNPGAVAALLAHLCASPQGIAKLRSAVEWLEPAVDGVLPSFNALFGEEVGAARELVDAENLEELYRTGGQPSIRFLLRAASYRSRLSFVLPGFAHWLARGAVRQTADCRYWGEVAMELSVATSAEGAWLDLALLATGNNPKSLFAGKFDPAGFARTLASGWQTLIAALDSKFQAGRAADDLLVTALVDYLGRYTWRDSQEQVDLMRDLTGYLCANGARTRLKAAVLDPVQVLRQLSPKATSAVIAEICAQAYAGRATAEEVGRALVESGAIKSGIRAADLLECLHRLLAEQRGASFLWEEALAKQFTDGSFGEQTATEFAACVIQSSRTELLYRLNVLNTVVNSESAAAHFALTDADSEELDLTGKYFSDILKAARKRQGGFFSRRRDAREVTSDSGS